ncbi:hypothetical protein J2W80_006362 [Methylorubrum extorquens]|nr:hypothetical protein [Methylorubrum extorquens]MCP1591137.1 hypothetical protein [Methylorubrum extorquens]
MQQYNVSLNARKPAIGLYVGSVGHAFCDMH